MFKEFKTFIMRGNVMDLAVGVIIGAAFGRIVASLVSDIFMPLIGLIIGGIDFSGLSFTIGSAKVTYGVFINSVIYFLIIALVIFLMVKGINSLTQKLAAPPSEPSAPTMKECPRCISSIPIKATRCPHCTSDLT